MIKLASNTLTEDYEDLLDFVVSTFSNNIVKDTLIKQESLAKYHKIAIATKAFDVVSIVMSYLAINNYKRGARYYQTLLLLNDAKYLANSSNSNFAQKINLFCSGLIEYYEKNLDSCLNFIKASTYIRTTENSEVDELILKYQKKIEDENFNKSIASTPPLFIANEIKDDALLALLQVGRTMAVETNIDNLLTIIAQQIQQALNADRCTVFLLDDENNELWSKVALGLEMQEIRFPITKGLAGHVARSGETVNIKDAYESEYFNKDIDLKTGYTTKNILCMPIRNLSHQIVGVFQVLNKIDGNFTKEDEDLLVAIGSSAGIAIENANLFNKQKKLIEEQKKLFSSFIDTLAASIDARDKITSGHSKRVTGYACLICDKYNLTEKEKEVIKSASLLHDIGKIGIKDSVLQKEGKLTKNEYAHIKEHVRLTHDILSKVYISKNFKDVAKIASSHHEKFDGSGYYKGLSGKNIPFGGRILAVCDVFDAITSKRHYRNKMEIKDALAIIINGKGKHFDPNVVDKFLDIPTLEILKVMNGEKPYKLAISEKNFLKEFNLNQLYVILNKKEVVTNHEKKFVEIFQKYYH